MVTSVLLAPLAASSLAADPATTDAAEAGTYKLTLATMHKVEKTYRGFAAAVQVDPSLVDRLEALEASESEGEGVIASIDAAAKRMDAIPAFAKSAKGAGVTTREVVLFSYVLAGTAMASSMTEGKEPPPSEAAPALVENVRWYRANQAEVTHFLQEMDQLFPDDDADEDSDDEWTVEVEVPEGEVEGTEVEADSAAVSGE